MTAVFFFQPLMTLEIRLVETPLDHNHSLKAIDERGAVLRVLFCEPVCEIIITCVRKAKSVFCVQYPRLCWSAAD